MVSRDERGNSVVEFALVVSVLLLMLFGIAQFGLAFHVQQGLQAGAREGARTASLPSSTKSEVTSRVLQTVSAIDTSPALEQCPPTTVGTYCVSVTPDLERPCASGGPTVTVQISYRSRIDIPLWSSPEVTQSGSSVFRCES